MVIEKESLSGCGPGVCCYKIAEICKNGEDYRFVMLLRANLSIQTENGDQHHPSIYVGEP